MNAERKKRWVDNWAKTRAEGRRRFILTQGILGIGVTYAVFSLITKYLFDYGFTVSKIGEYFSRGEPAFKFFFDWLGFGPLMGFFLWHFYEYQFRKWAKKAR
ncbi:MAG: hypothetical protein M3362_06270 [Acidobacteriota bacterium]|nr:hypothetical protein [Acidobacteriota bacterium]